MSNFFSGTFWKTSGFGSSMFHGTPIVAGRNFFSGDMWKTSQFGTDFFHGPALRIARKRYWSGTFWKTSQFATTMYAGEPIAAPTTPTVRTSSGGGSQDDYHGGQSWNMPFWDKPKKRKLSPVLLAAIAEEDEL